MDQRLYLSSPHMSGLEQAYIQEAFDTNWVSTVGSHINDFEREFAEKVGVGHAVAVSSGTAALHLALVLAGVVPDDNVLVSTLTFVASVNPIIYQGGRPFFVDSEYTSWNMDPDLLADALKKMARQGRLPKAVVLVHLYGQSANIDPILEVCNYFGVILIEDAAEALGATYKNRMPGSLGKMGIYSFNGNKIITTSGGGMLVSNDGDLIDKARKLATQARDPAPHYQHSDIGYNYRLSNILAAIGRGQLQVLKERVEARRHNFEYYYQALRDLPGIDFMPEASWGYSTRWLSCITVDASVFGASTEDIRRVLESENIESRPLWKPMHLQPIFKKYEAFGGQVSEALFEKGLCLPSGSNLNDEDLERVVNAIRSQA